jgi:hypothetical protein
VGGHRGEAVDTASVDQGHTGGEPAGEACARGIELAAVELREAARGFVLLLTEDHERLPDTLRGLRFSAFACS